MRKFLYKGNKIEYIEKKSKFIAESFVVRSQNECEEILQAIRKKYWDATHNCYAYRISENEKKCSDDGEPSKTAGYPILDVIDKNEINNCMIIVTRYFGGILLGTGGLVHAYSQSSSLSMKESTILTANIGYNIKITLPYDIYPKANYIFYENDVYIKDISYEDRVTCDIYIFEENIQPLKKKMQSLLKVEEPFILGKPIYYAIHENEIIRYEY